MASLFRPEAINGQRQNWLGSITLIRPLSLSVLTSFAVGAAVLVGACLYWGEYTRKARVSGYLVPDRGLLRVVPPAGATIVSREVTEGQVVRRGDVLFVLSLDSSTAQGDTQSNIQQSLDAREQSLQQTSQQRTLLLKEQLQDLAQRVAGKQRELEAAAEDAKVREQRLVLARQTLADWEGLRRDNYVSAAQVRTKHQEVLDLESQRLSLKGRIEELQRELQTLDTQRRELPLRAQAQQGEIKRELAALAQQGAESEAKRRVVLRAAEDGVVTAVQAEPGQMVTAGLALASLVPAQAQLLAHLYAPSSAVGFLRPAQAVQLRYQAFPYQKFGHQTGQIVQVSRTPLAAAELSALPLAANSRSEPLYRITVSLDRQAVAAYGQDQALAVGMQLDADVLLERRRLIEWIFEPLLSVAKRV
ncbi:MAG: HlyD family efflux transporter periplasmic adaptor subunit [Burkholderiaceae bacterium]|nr:HlyD family efflux transporter periplasmic adaptor subunit [Burkholderiaceae bacterium]